MFQVGEWNYTQGYVELLRFFDMFPMPVSTTRSYAQEICAQCKIKTERARKKIVFRTSRRRRVNRNDYLINFWRM